MRIVFMGTPDFAAKALEAIYNAGHDVTLVVTMPDKPKGRKKEPTPSEVKLKAQELGLPIYQPLSLKSDEVYERLSDERADLIVVTAYGKIIPKRILDLPKYGCINEHASLLPAYRGAAPIQWAILDGLEKTGVTIMYMGEGLDTGDIISKCEVKIEPDDTSESLFEKLSKEGAKLLTDTILKIKDGKASRVQQPTESTTPYAKMITKADGAIDFSRSAKELDCFVRGMNSWPCAYTKLKGKLLKIWTAKPLDKNAEGEIGTVVKADKDGFYIQTGKGLLSVLELQIEGKKKMDYETFLRGCKVETGTKLG